MTVKLHINRTARCWTGLSSDNKPTLTVDDLLDEFYETDTQLSYYWYGASWEVELEYQPANPDIVIDASYVHTDNNFTTLLKGNYDTAYSWGNHASAGYLTSETSHADVLVDGDIGSAVQAWGVALDTINTNGEDAYLLADGSRDITGELTTSNGSYSSSLTASATVAPLQFKCDSNVFGGADGTKLASFLDVNGNGVEIYKENSGFGKALVISAPWGGAAFNSLKFETKSLLGTIVFQGNTLGTYMGMRPDSSYLTTTQTHMSVSLLNQSATHFSIEPTAVSKGGAAGLRDLGKTGTRWDTLYNTGIDCTGDVALGTDLNSLLGFYGATPVTQPTALTASNTSTPTGTDAAIIANLQTRVDELEAKLQALGAIA